MLIPPENTLPSKYLPHFLHKHFRGLVNKPSEGKVCEANKFYYLKFPTYYRIFNLPVKACLYMSA